MANDIVPTGPPYPPLPGAGSNAVGRLIVGQSQIGDIPPFDWHLTIISQFANSPILTTLIGNFFAYIDQTANLDAFYDLIWNIDTAQGVGLDIWGRIVGVNRVLQIAGAAYFGFAEALPGSLSWNDAGPPSYGPFLGFAEAGDGQPFGFGTFGLYKTYLSPQGIGGIFYSGETLTQNYRLADQSYRQLILAKAAANITDGSIPAINQILMTLFPNRGNCYVTEGSQAAGSWFGFAESQNAQPFNQAPFYTGQTIPTMTMTYTFEFQLSPVELAIVQQSGVLPKSTGVAASVVIL